MLKKMFLILALAAIAISCTEDDGNGGGFDCDAYMPMEIGKFKKVDIYSIDENENRIEKLRSGDQVGYASMTMIGDKNCYVMTGTDAEGNVTFQAPQYRDGCELWVDPVSWEMYVQYYKNVWGDFPFEPAEDELWLLADLSRDKWDSFEEKTVDDFRVREGALMDLTINMFGEKTREFTMEIDGQTYETVEFVSRFVVEGESVVDGVTTQINGVHVQKYVYAKGEGLVHYISVPFTINYGFGPIPIPGEESIAVEIPN